jgi:hypothetical protein
MTDNNRAYGAGVRGPQSGVLWHAASLSPVSENIGYVLPVVDPDPSSRLPVADNSYLGRARSDRSDRASSYLQMWLTQLDPDGSLSIEALDHLDRLLNQDFPSTNVPLVLRDGLVPDDLMFVSVVSRRHVDLLAPQMYRNWLASDAQTFAQVELYLVKPRHECCPWYWEEQYVDEMGQTRTRIIPNMDASSDWTSFNQNWSSRLVPATSDAIPVVLRDSSGGLRGLPRLDGSDWKNVNTH